MAFVMLEIVVGEQDLGDVQSELRKELFVGRHQPGLADGRASLQFRQFGGPFVVAEHAHARADRAGGDDRDFAPARRWAATCATSCSICARSGCLRLSVRTPVPSLTTIRLTCFNNSRRISG